MSRTPLRGRQEAGVPAGTVLQHGKRAVCEPGLVGDVLPPDGRGLRPRRVRVWSETRPIQEAGVKGQGGAGSRSALYEGRRPAPTKVATCRERISMKRKKQVIQFCLILFLGLSMGCQPRVQPVQTVTPQTSLQQASPSKTVTPPEPTATTTLTQTAQPTVTPSLYFPPTPAISLTPLPRLGKSEARLLVEELLQTNGGCRLPCWWGITPGKTTWSEASQFLQSFALEVTVYEPEIKRKSDSGVVMVQVYSASFEINDAKEIGWVSFTVLNYEFIEVITIGPLLTKTQFTMPQLFAQNGEPEVVYIRTYSSSPALFIPMIVSIYSPKNRYLAVYNLDATNQNGVVVGCMPPTGSYLFTWAWEEISKDFIQRNSVGYSKQFELRPIEEVTGYTVHSFYEKYKADQGEICIESDASYW